MNRIWEMVGKTKTFTVTRKTFVRRRFAWA